MNTCFQVEICLKIRGSGRYLQAAAGKSLDEAMQRGVFYLFRTTISFGFFVRQFVGATFQSLGINDISAATPQQ